MEDLLGGFFSDDFFFDLRRLDAAVLETGIDTPQVDVSSAGLRLLSLSPGSFCVLPSPSRLRPRHDDQMVAVYLERLDG